MFSASSSLAKESAVFTAPAMAVSDIVAPVPDHAETSSPLLNVPSNCCKTSSLFTLLIYDCPTLLSITTLSTPSTEPSFIATTTQQVTVPPEKPPVPVAFTR